MVLRVSGTHFVSGFLSSPRDTAVTALPSRHAQSHVDAHTVTSFLGVGRRTPHDDVWEPIRVVAPSSSRLSHRHNGHEQAASEAERSGARAWCPWVSALKRRLRASGVCVSQARGAVSKPPLSCACSPWDCQAVPLGLLKEVSFLFFF